eukprot:85533-Pelagomonas_calceolata.AAC.2
MLLSRDVLNRAMTKVTTKPCNSRTASKEFDSKNIDGHAKSIQGQACKGVCPVCPVQAGACAHLK